MSHNGWPDDRSVLVIDNWKGHKHQGFIDACQDLNIIIEYGEPYAPDIMPHEICGGAAKEEMKRNVRAWTEEGLSDRQQIEVAFGGVGPNVVKAACHEMGYENFRY